MFEHNSTTSQLEPLLTYQQAAEKLGVTDRTIWKMVDEGALPAVRFGRTVRIDPADLQTFVDRNKQQGKTRSRKGDGS